MPRMKTKTYLIRYSRFTDRFTCWLDWFTVLLAIRIASTLVGQGNSLLDDIISSQSSLRVKIMAHPIWLRALYSRSVVRTQISSRTRRRGWECKTYQQKGVGIRDGCARGLLEIQSTRMLYTCHGEWPPPPPGFLLVQAVGDILWHHATACMTEDQAFYESNA
jgi:hypothetical protein